MSDNILPFGIVTPETMPEVVKTARQLLHCLIDELSQEEVMDLLSEMIPPAS